MLSERKQKKKRYSPKKANLWKSLYGKEANIYFRLVMQTVFFSLMENMLSTLVLL